MFRRLFTQAIAILERWADIEVFVVHAHYPTRQGEKSEVLLVTTEFVHALQTAANVSRLGFEFEEGTLVIVTRCTLGKIHPKDDGGQVYRRQLHQDRWSER